MTTYGNTFIPYDGPVSLDDVRRVFGYINNIPADDLNDFHGVTYYELNYPYRQGKFNSTLNGSLSLSDFRGKTSIDPATPGSFTDFISGSNKTFILPVFRNQLIIEIWGAGGGGSGGNHDYTPDPGASGNQTDLTIPLYYGNIIIPYSISATGGGGGTGGYRYGDQNGHGGGGGTGNALPTGGVTIITQNGNSGGGGDAGGRRGGIGGSAYNGGSGGYQGVGDFSGNPMGGNGNSPGAGGGGGGWSDQGSKNPNQAAGGGGGSGGYVSITVPRYIIGPGSFINYNIGTGGAGLKQNGGNAEGQGGDGAAGGFRISWN